LNWKKVKIRLTCRAVRVAVAGDAGCPEIILNDEHRHGGVLGNHHRPDHAWLGKYHVIALGADATETLSFEHLDQLFIRKSG
jgi:hypothetical protein